MKRRGRKTKKSKSARAIVNKVLDSRIPYKTYDSELNTAPTSSGSINYKSSIEQGTDYNDRVSNMILVKSIRIKAYVASNTSAATDPTVFRLLLIVDRKNQGSDPTMAELLQSTTYTISGLPNVANADRFWFVLDKRIVLEPNTTSGRGAVIDYYHSFKKPLKVQYRGTTSGVASADKNAIYLVYATNTSTYNPTIQGYIRIKYQNPS